MLRLKRVYEPPSRSDGRRYLVERLWPRGLRKQALALEAWLKEVGPSDRLRKWFGHDPAKWQRFKEKYFQELDARPDAWEPIRKSARGRTVTLLFSSHDQQHNNAVALKQYLERKSKHRRAASSHAG